MLTCFESVSLLVVFVVVAAAVVGFVIGLFVARILDI